MKFGNRVMCFAFSMAVAGAVYTQIPVGSGFVAAYGGGGGGKTVFTAAAAAGAIDIVATSLTGAGAGSIGTIPAASKPVSSPGDGSSIETTPDPPPVTAGGTTDLAFIDAAASSAANPDLSTFAALSDVPGVKDALTKGGPYTIFAPTNAAFDDLGKNLPTHSDVVSEYKKPENLSLLKAFLFSYVVKGKYTIVDLKNREGQKLVTLNNKSLTISAVDDLKVNEIAVQETDIPAANAIIHPIGQITSPPSPVAAATAK